MVTAAAAAVLATWLYLLLFRGGFWLFREERPDANSAAFRDATSAPAIAIVIPARNEAEVVGKAARSLAAQNYPGRFHIFLVDDASTDGTAETARSAAPPEILTIVPAAPLPENWSGKLWAVSQGVAQGAAFRPDYLLLTDADIVHAPGNLAALAGHAQCGNYAIVSIMATLQCRTAAERALVPAFVFFFFLLYPPAWIRNPRRATAGAAGGCILIRREALEGIGGIAAIRDQLIDDCALARAVKRNGGRVWLGLSEGVRSIREYSGFGDIWNMIARTAFTQLHHSAALLLATELGLAFTYWLPPGLALGAGWPAAAFAAAAWCLMSIAYFPALRFYRRSPLWAPLLPLTATFYAGATVASAVAYWRGTGGLWKGRVQDQLRGQ